MTEIKATEQRYYWLRLKRDFFKRHDIRIIEEMPNGKDYVLFYLKLLVESIDHDGNLRFSDTIPYNEQMLSVITNTNVDVVRSALKIFGELKMVDILDDKTVYMTELERLVGSETYWAGKKREQRNSRKLLDNVQSLSNVSKQEKEKEKEIEKELELEREKELDEGTRENGAVPSQSPLSKPKKPPVAKHKYGEFKNVLLSDNELDKLQERFPDWQTRIDDLSYYINSHGKKYASHYATLLNWARKDEKKAKERNPNSFESIARDLEEMGL